MIGGQHGSAEGEGRRRPARPRSQRELHAQVKLQAEMRAHYRNVAGKLLLKGRPSTPWLIGITSAVRGEGKTTLAYGLASTFAADLSEMVALVEFDFERPVMAADMGLDPVAGLAEVVQDGLPLRAAAHPGHLPNLTVVPAGQARGEMAQLVHSPRFGQIWPEFSQLGSVVICDLPAVLANPTTPLLARGMTTTVLSVQAGVTPVPVIKQALALLDRADLAGVVLNGEVQRLPRWLRRLLGDADV
jgi:Mrp family chromosome partitioning ATPase